MDTPTTSVPGPLPSGRRNRLGRLGEDIAADALRDLGLQVLARNWRLTTGALRGELDLVCRDGDTLVVVEVKTRRARAVVGETRLGDRFGGPLGAVTRDKQIRIRALATAFLRAEQVRAARVRFDVIGVTVGPGAPGRVRVEHVTGAF
jgi:putative endonuclease